MWNDGVVHGEYGGVLWCKMCRCLWNTECCGMAWRHRHCGMMWNDGWIAVRAVWCALECAPIWMWCSWRGARWDVGVMWNGVPRCGGAICELRCDMECYSFRHGVMQNVIETQNVRCDERYGVVSWYVNCCIMQDVECYDVILNVVWNCGVKNVAWNMLWILCDVRCGN